MRFKDFLTNISEEQKDMLPKDEDENFAEWKEDCKKAHPKYAAKMRFNARYENGKHIVSAEVGGLDRSFGVWHMNSKSGEVLGD